MNKRISFLIILILLLNMSFVVFAEDTLSEPTGSAIEENLSNQSPTEEAITTPDNIDFVTNTGPAVNDSQNNINDKDQAKVAAVGNLPDGVTITGGTEGVDYTVEKNTYNENYMTFNISSTGLVLSGSSETRLMFNINFAKNEKLDFTLSNLDTPNSNFALWYWEDLNLSIIGNNKADSFSLYGYDNTSRVLTVGGIDGATLSANRFASDYSADKSNTTFENIKIICPDFDYGANSIIIKDSVFQANKRFRVNASTWNSNTTNTYNNIDITDSQIESPKNTNITANGNISLNGLSGTLASIPDNAKINAINPLSIPDGVYLYTSAIVGARNNLSIQVTNNEELIINQQIPPYDDRFDNIGTYGGNGINIDEGNTLVDSKGALAYIKEIQLKISQNENPPPTSAFSVTDKDGNAINSFSIKGEITSTDTDDKGSNEKDNSNKGTEEDNPVNKTNDASTKSDSPTTNDSESPYLWIFLIMLCAVTAGGVNRTNAKKYLKVVD